MTFNDRLVTLDDGREVRLKSLWVRKPVAFVFLRHFGCVFCRDHVAKLSKHPELNIVLVASAPASNAAVFRQTTNCPFPIIADPEQILYDEAGLSHASFSQVASLEVLKAGMLAMKAGHRNSKPESDATIMGGAFVIGTNGHSLLEHRAKNVADNISVQDLETALNRQRARS